MSDESNFFHSNYVLEMTRTIPGLKLNDEEKALFELLQIALNEITAITAPESIAFPCAISVFKNQLPDYFTNPREKMHKSVAGGLLATLYYFLSESEFQLKIKSNAVSEINRYLKKLDEDTQNLIIQFRQSVGYDIVNHLIKQDGFKAVNELIEIQKKSKSEQNAWNKTFEEQTKAINENRNYLQGMKTEYGFVALKFGFQKLQNEKNKQANTTITLLVLFGLLMIAIPVLELFWLTSGASDNNKETVLALLEKPWIVIIPTITVQALLIYFFRIALSDYKSIKTQQLQIDLRISICQFFESYTDFVKKNTNSENSLSKFENLMFSNIVSNDSHIPTIFDGTEQIAKVIEAMKK